MRPEFFVLPLEAALLEPTIYRQMDEFYELHDDEALLVKGALPAFINSMTFATVARAKGETVGFHAFEVVRGKVVELKSLLTWTAPRWRRRGVARQMWMESTGWCAARKASAGCTSFEGMVLVDGLRQDLAIDVDAYWVRDQPFPVRIFAAS